MSPNAKVFILKSITNGKHIYRLAISDDNIVEGITYFTNNQIHNLGAYICEKFNLPYLHFNYDDVYAVAVNLINNYGITSEVVDVEVNFSLYKDDILIKKE